MSKTKTSLIRYRLRFERKKREKKIVQAIIDDSLLRFTADAALFEYSPPHGRHIFCVLLLFADEKRCLFSDEFFFADSNWQFAFISCGRCEANDRALVVIAVWSVAIEMPFQGWLRVLRVSTELNHNNWRRHLVISTGKTLTWDILVYNSFNCDSIPCGWPLGTPSVASPCDFSIPIGRKATDYQTGFELWFVDFLFCFA